jgi:SOS-response transcriptional repressor LexA
MAFFASIEETSQQFDLNALCVRHPAATYFMRVNGDAPEHHLCTGDVIVVDRSVAPQLHTLVVCIQNGEFVLYKDGEARHQENTEVWGVIVSVIRQLT